LVEQFIEYLAVVYRRMGYCIAWYELVARIGVDVAFVAIMFLVVFLRPARFGIFLPSLGLSFRLIPRLRYLTLFNMGVLCTGIALLRDFDKDGTIICPARAT
jgi:hypothetical protein